MRTIRLSMGMLLAGSVLIALLVAVTTGVSSSEASITACNLEGPLRGGASLTSTLSVTDADGSDVTNDGTGYQVCITPNGSEAFSIVVALSNRTEDLGVANLGRTFTVGFSLPEATSATSAELYADVQSYTIATNGRDISLVMKPVSITSGTDGDSPTPLQDTLARITGGIRFNATGSTSHGIVGMWIGASANRYAVTMGGSCPNFASGADSGSTTPGSIDVRLWAPHMTAGTLSVPVVNTGSLEAFIPEATATACFGGASLEEIVAALAVARTEVTESPTTLVPGTQFTARAVTGGLLISVPTVTFSSPTYRISAPSLVKDSAAAGTSKVTDSALAAAVGISKVKASALAKRKGSKAVVTVTIPVASAGKNLIIAEKVGKKYVTRSSTKAKSGSYAITLRINGNKGRAVLKITLDGKTIANLKV
ncbi:MAG: hypothetical protein WCK20_03240 [Thermoleophilia bacterium]